MRFKRIAASKFRPKHTATKRNDIASMYHPRPLKAAKQQIDTEGLPDSVAAVRDWQQTHSFPRKDS